MGRRRWLLALTALLLTLSGCAGLLGDDGDADPAAIGDRIDDRIESMDAVAFTLEQTVETGNETVSFRSRVVYAPPDRIHITYLDGPVPYTRAVSNGTTSWLYDETTGEVRVTDRPIVTEPSGILPGVEGLGGNATFEGNETLAGEDATEISFAVDDSEVSLLLGGGRETSRIGGNTSQGTVETRVWIDTDLWLPRKAELTITAFQPNRTVTLTYEDFEVEPAIADDQFTFEPPADATVDHGDQSAFRPPPENVTRYDSRAALVGNAPVPVPDPPLPAGYELETASVVTEADREGVELTYANGTDRLEVVALEGFDPFFDGGETVAVGDTEGLYVELPDARILQWECGDRLYLVASQGGDPSLQSIADAIGCR
jgi:outer membrane lipoprotein-sorting protein